MNVDHVTGQVLSGPLAPAYVYEAPVRLAHWIMAICITGLAVTGYLIGAPLPSINGEATHHYLFGYIRMIHFIFGWVLGVTFLARVYWAIVGNQAARAIFVVPVWRGRWWRGLLSQVAYYLFLRKEPALWVGHNPLAQPFFTGGTNGKT